MQRVRRACTRQHTHTHTHTHTHWGRVGRANNETAPQVSNQRCANLSGTMAAGFRMSERIAVRRVASRRVASRVVRFRMKLVTVPNLMIQCPVTSALGDASPGCHSVSADFQRGGGGKEGFLRGTKDSLTTFSLPIDGDGIINRTCVWG